MPSAPLQKPKFSATSLPSGVTTEMKPASGPCRSRLPLCTKYWSCSASYSRESGARTTTGSVTSTTTSGAPS
eukprot:3745493-Pyramimonas_sp.AAC.1